MSGEVLERLAGKGREDYVAANLTLCKTRDKTRSKTRVPAQTAGRRSGAGASAGAAQLCDAILQ